MNCRSHETCLKSFLLAFLIITPVLSWLFNKFKNSFVCSTNLENKKNVVVVTLIQVQICLWGTSYFTLKKHTFFTLRFKRYLLNYCSRNYLISWMLSKKILAGLKSYVLHFCIIFFSCGINDTYFIGIFLIIHLHISHRIYSINFRRHG